MAGRTLPPSFKWDDWDFEQKMLVIRHELGHLQYGHKVASNLPVPLACALEALAEYARKG